MKLTIVIAATALAVYLLRRRNNVLRIMISAFIAALFICWFYTHFYIGVKILLTAGYLGLSVLCLFFDSFKIPDDSLLNKDFREPGDELVDDIEPYLPSDVDLFNARRRLYNDEFRNFS